LKTLFGGSL